MFLRFSMELKCEKNIVFKLMPCSVEVSLRNSYGKNPVTSTHITRALSAIVGSSLYGTQTFKKQIDLGQICYE